MHTILHFIISGIMMNINCLFSTHVDQVLGQNQFEAISKIQNSREIIYEVIGYINLTKLLNDGLFFDLRINKLDFGMQVHLDFVKKWIDSKIT